MGENRLSSLLELLPEDPEVMVGMSTHHVPCTMASSHPHGWAAQTPPSASHSVRSLAQKVGVSPRGLWSASQLCSQQESGLLCFIGLVSVSLSLGLLPWATPPRSAGTQPCPGISTPRTGVLVPLRPATSSPG